MLKNHLKIAYRALWRRKGYAALNVAGLAVGMACVLLIALFVRSELSYDRFHDHADRIVRIVGDQVVEGELQTYSTTQGLLAPALAEDLPEVEHTVRLVYAEPVFTVGTDRFRRTDVLYADSTFFEVFDGYELLRGAPGTVLDAPDRIVLSETLARDYFGRTDVVGETITDRGTVLTVTGVMADVPDASHLRFSAVISLTTPDDPGWWYTNWSSFAFFTYALLRDGDDVGPFRAKLPAFMQARAGAEMEASGQQLALQAEPLTDVYLRSDRSGGGGGEGSVGTLYAFGAIAGFVLLIACLNFTNLATARSAERAKEVGVRKTMGAARESLALQFLTEAVLLSLLALGLGVLLAQLAGPAFEALTGKDVRLLDLGPWLLGLGGLALGTGLMAGAYPALVLSSYRPAQVLKGRFATSRRGTRLRQGLVVLQLVITIGLIAGTAVVFDQLRYMQNRDLGFDPGSEETQLLTLDFGGDAAVQERLATIKDRLLRISGVEGVASSMVVPATTHPSAGGGIERPEGGFRDMSVEMYLVDTAFVEVYGMELVAGRKPGASTTADSLTAYVLNETAVRRAGYASPEAILGRTAGFWGMEGRVVGVVKDFHTRGLQAPVPPLGLAAVDAYQSVLTLRVRTAALPQTLEALEATWRELAPQRPFDYRFLDDAFGAQYEAERRFGRVFGTFAGLAILIACLGLFGLAAYTAQQRTKEIGIRKVLGASVPSLVVLLSRDVVVLVAVAFVLAAPLVYVAMQRWLDGFAYATTIGWEVFAMAGALALVVTLLTVSLQSLRAATADPVESLRSE